MLLLAALTLSDPTPLRVYNTGRAPALNQSSTTHHTSSMTTIILAQQLFEAGIITRTANPFKTSNSPVCKTPKTATMPAAQKLPTKLYSNSLVNCVKTFCCECDKPVNLSGLSKHLVKNHKHLSNMQYRQLHGDPQDQIIQMVFHNCALCKKDIVNDYVALVKHLKGQHKTSMTKYSSEHMNRDQALT